MCPLLNSVRITVDRLCEVNGRGIHQELMIPKDQDHNRKGDGGEDDLSGMMRVEDMRSVRASEVTGCVVCVCECGRKGLMGCGRWGGRRGSGRRQKTALPTGTGTGDEWMEAE